MQPTAFMIEVLITREGGSYQWAYQVNGQPSNGEIVASGPCTITYFLNPASNFELIYANLKAGPGGNVTSQLVAMTQVQLPGFQGITLVDQSDSYRRFNLTLVAKDKQAADPNAPIFSDPEVQNEPPAPD